MKGFCFAQTADVDEYEAGLRAFLEGRMPEERFTPFRLQMGIYGQRQEGVHMVRVKLPGGNLTPAQLDVIGDCVQRWAGEMNQPKLAHITTRQDIQANFVSLENTLPFLRRLDEAGLTTREACGNTVRNVSSCFLAGVCPIEHVDVSLHARAFAEYFLRHPLAQQFPRKFKVAFSGCDRDCALGGMHDIGFVATRQDGEVGFRVWAAGGLSSQPMGALLLESFIPERDMLWVGEAVMRMHFKYSDRKRRARARLKYVAQKLGVEGFIEEYRRQKAAIEKFHARRPLRVDIAWRAEGGGELQVPENGVLRQHDGRNALLLHIFRGDLTPEQCHAIADVCRDVEASGLRVTAEQGMVITGIEDARVEAAIDALARAGLSCARARGIADVVACPGTETCRLGITSSRGLAEALRPLLRQVESDPRLAALSVKASGCQHSCARHHVADLGFHGLAKKVQGRAVPHYQLHIGGSGRGGEAMAFATDAVPARHAPQAGMAVLRAYREQAGENESLHAWASRLGAAGVNAILAEFRAQEGEVEGLVYDWNENEVFNTRGNKKGECAGAVLSMSDALLSEAEYEWMMARAHLDAMFWQEAGESLHRCAISLARAFLVPYGEAPEDDAVVFSTLAAQASADGEVMQGLQAVQQALMRLDLQDPGAGMHARRDAIAPWLQLALRRFAPVPSEPEAAEESRSEASSREAAASEEAPLLDLHGVACPMNFVKTKIRMTTMPLGAELQVVLDDGPPIENVPLSLEEQGQKVLSKERLPDGAWLVRVRKVAEF